MKVRILGGGWYGCHLALALKRDGHEVELQEIGPRLFNGASGGNPARLHLGPHYPRSFLTRQACQRNHAEFMAGYGHLTRSVALNIYAIASDDSLVDFGNYVQVLRGEIEFVTIESPNDHGLQNVEGAILTGERHIVIDEARAYFERELSSSVRLDCAPVILGSPQDDNWEGDWTIDCTFCARDGAGIDRYEPCITALMLGDPARALTIMDGPFPSIYPWNEAQRLSSLTSARYTPISRCLNYPEAVNVLRTTKRGAIDKAVGDMVAQLGAYWPDSHDLYKLADVKLSIRAMPRSGASARLVDVVQQGPKLLRVRAGKIDAVFHAEHIVRGFLGC